jgi:hypothetical protein
MGYRECFCIPNQIHSKTNDDVQVQRPYSAPYLVANNLPLSDRLAFKVNDFASIVDQRSPRDRFRLTSFEGNRTQHVVRKVAKEMAASSAIRTVDDGNELYEVVTLFHCRELPLGDPR